MPELGFGGVTHWWMTHARPSWPRAIEEPPGPRPPARVGPGEMRVTLIGHSTLLLQLDGINVLTDPIYSEVSGPLSWVGVPRIRPPAVRYEDLPRIDVVIVSHNHYDHMDLPTLQRLGRDHAPVVVVGLGNERFLTAEGVPNVRALDWWQTTKIKGVEVAAVPVQHGSRRGLSDSMGTLWCGYVVTGPEAGRAYFAGDTGWGPHFAQVGQRYAPIRLAMLPIGAYLPRRYLAPVHISPTEAVRAHRALKA
ncbi:MAG: L-ascorbate metabolism protein UlaG (beta-lactamase superfamily), partial [Myxococcota bacterium]